MSALHTNIPESEKGRLRVLEHLEELLESQAFAGSRRRQAFLRYVVEETLAGRGSAIKETNIAMDVFGRASDFDAQTASIVRVTAADVRKRLSQAYASGLGRDLRIELPLGGYQPAFQFLAAEPEEIVQEPLPALVSEATPTKGRRAWWWPAAAVVFAFVAVGWLLGPRLVRSESPMDLLWRPFLSGDSPVLISLMAPTLLNVDNHEKWLPLQPGGNIPTSELEALEGSYVGSGAALGAALFAEQLASRDQKFVLKFGSDATFADLKNSPAILIGVSRWTQELNSKLRFQLRVDGERMVVVDSRRANQQWVIQRKRQSSQLVEGYSLVTRLLQSESGHPVLMVVGMDARNTQAAVEFLSRSDSFQRFAQSAPRDWARKSFQVVLHNTIHGNSPGSLVVVASEVW